MPQPGSLICYNDISKKQRFLHSILSLLVINIASLLFAAAVLVLKDQICYFKLFLTIFSRPMPFCAEGAKRHY